MSHGRLISLTLSICIAAMLCLALSCSTTKVLKEGEYRLAMNTIQVENKKDYPGFKASQVENYVQQKANSYSIKGKHNGWSPMLYVYNWENGKGKGWDKFVHKLGVPPVIYDPTMTVKSIDNIQTRLKYLGYYDSKVRDSLVLRGKNAQVYYIVHLGKQYPIKQINYNVSDSVLSREMSLDIKSSLIKHGLPLSEDLFESETVRATKHLNSVGYYRFTKNYFSFEVDTVSARDSCLVDVIVRDYTRFETPAEARPHSKFVFGNIKAYPVSDVIKHNVVVSKKIPEVFDTVDFKDMTILYDGKHKIRPKVLYRMNRIVPGTQYDPDMVDLTYERFSQLRLYSSTSIELNEADSNVVDVNVHLIPAKVHGYKINLEASVNSSGLLGLQPSISYFNRNIFHGAEQLSISAMGNFQYAPKTKKSAIEAGAGLSLSFPRFVPLPDRIFKYTVPRTDVSINYNYQNRPEYTRNMIGANVGWSWYTRSEKWYFSISPIQLNIVNLPRKSDEFIQSLKNPFVREAYKNHFDLGLGTRFTFNSNPKRNPVLSTLRVDLQFDIAGNLMSAFNKFMPVDSTGAHNIWGSPYSQFVRAEASIAYTHKFGDSGQHALDIRFVAGAGYAYGNSQKMPFERLFWAGGSNSLRGWVGRSIGPGGAPLDTTFSIPNPTGDMRLEANLEYRFPIIWLLKGALFFDWGNVWNVSQVDEMKVTEQTLDNTYFTWENLFKYSAFNTGVGLRFDIKNMIVIRFDFAFKLYDPRYCLWIGKELNQKAGIFAFQFGIGYPF